MSASLIDVPILFESKQKDTQTNYTFCKETNALFSLEGFAKNIPQRDTIVLLIEYRFWKHFCNAIAQNLEMDSLNHLVVNSDFE